MISLSDFAIGQSVIVTEDGILKPQKRTVKHIGRKYVTLYGNWNEKFYKGYGKSYLVEKCEYGSSRRLYPSQQSFNDDKERLTLWRFIMNKISPVKPETIDLESLKKIKEILEEAEEEEK